MLDNFKRWFAFKFLSVLFSFLNFWKASKIKDKILYPVIDKPVKFPEIVSNIGQELLQRMKANFDRNGDFEVLTNSCFMVEGKTTSCGEKSKNISEMIRDSQLYAAAFWNAGVRKGKKML